MKKLSLLVLGILFCIISCGQVFLGNSFGYINKQLYPLTITQQDGFYTATYDNGSTEQVYFFDKDNICYLYTIIIDKECLSLYTDEFDRRYSIVKEYVWKEIETNMVIDIVFDTETFIRFYYE
jgi:hypothetical protein